MEIKLVQFDADAQHEHEKHDFFEVMGCCLSRKNYDTRIKITGELQLLLNCGRIIKPVAFLNRNQLNNKVLQLQVNFQSKIESI